MNLCKSFRLNGGEFSIFIFIASREIIVLLSRNDLVYGRVVLAAWYVVTCTGVSVSVCEPCEVG